MTACLLQVLHYVQVTQSSDMHEVNTLLASMNWFELAGLPQQVNDLMGRDDLVTRAANWLAFGRTRPAMDRCGV